MNALKDWLPVLTMTLLCGCLQVRDELTLQPDGSGRVNLTLHANLPEELIDMIQMSSRYAGGSAPVYPPTSEAEARRCFPSRDFSLKVEETNSVGGRTILIEGAFRDVNTLLASPYGRSHQLALTTNADRTLKLRGVSGGSLWVRGLQFNAEGGMGSLDLPGMEDALKRKGEMRFEFRATLPNAITAANGARENRTATWTFKRAQCRDDDEFGAQLSGVFEATCSAEGLTFNPVTPPRLGLLPFSQLTAGKAAVASAIPDTNKIVAAAQFVPYLLHVTRSLDFSGEDFGRGSGGQLTGAVILPPEFAPQRWGPVKLLEVVDARGRSLMPKDEAASTMSRFAHYARLGAEGESDEEDDEETKAQEAGPTRRIITLNFRAPEWNTKRIAKIRGVAELQYLGGSEVIKLQEAVPAAFITDTNQRSSANSSVHSERGQVADQRLRELGLFLRVGEATAQKELTTLSLETSGGLAALVEAQVFDADGKPWPTLLWQDSSAGGEERSCQLMVAGRPKPPFSLALVVDRLTASVEVPIVVENVPVGDE